METAFASIGTRFARSLQRSRHSPRRSRRFQGASTKPRNSAMARFFISRRFGPWRAGVSLGPEDLRQRRRGRLLASPKIVRPARSFYGLALDQPDPSAAPPHVHHPWRDAWTIVTI